MNNLNALKVGNRSLLALSLLVTLALAFTFTMLPVKAHAATYAYVNTSGNVSSVVADTWMSAIATAIGISLHSGVLLLNAFGDNGGILGDNVSGV